MFVFEIATFIFQVIRDMFVWRCPLNKLIKPRHLTVFHDIYYIRINLFKSFYDIKINSMDMEGNTVQRVLTERETEDIEIRRTMAIERFMANVLVGLQDPVGRDGEVGRGGERGVDMEGDNLVDRLFREETSRVRPVAKTFVEGLEVKEVMEDLTDECSICLECFKGGDTYIELPCKDKPHKFHYHKEGEVSQDVCQGIGPWFKVNNRCPMCRHEFPGEETTEVEEESDEEESEESDVRQITSLSELLEMIYPSRVHITRTRELRLPMLTIGNMNQRYVADVQVLRAIEESFRTNEGSDTSDHV